MRLFKICSLLFMMINLSVFSQTMKEYKTVKGESLRDVAEKFGFSYRALMDENPEVSRWPKENTLVRIPQKTHLNKEIKHPKDLRSGDNSELITAPVEDLVKPGLELKKDLRHPVDLRPDNKSNLITAPAKDSGRIHVVKPKETLFNLSKRYGLPVATLIKNNPILSSDGLKIGQVLRIPFKRTITVKTSKNHIVKEKETWYAISKKYNVTVEALKKVNLESAVNGLKIGAVIEIPDSVKRENLQDVLEEKTIKMSNDSVHIVAAGETLYALARAYGVSISELSLMNGAISADSLSIGTALNVPVKRTDSIIAPILSSTSIYKRAPIFYHYEIEKDILSAVLEDYVMTLDQLKELNPKIDSIMEYGGDLLMGYRGTGQLFEGKRKFKDSLAIDIPLKVMLMLPFDFKKNDILSQEVLFANPKGLPTIVSDFYLGAKKAVDSLKSQGQQVELIVVDTEKSVNAIHKKIDTLKAMNPDLIIGPLYSNNTMYVATKFSDTPIFYPIYSKKQSGFINTNIFKTATNKELVKKEMVSYVQENRGDKHLIVVGTDKDIKELYAIQKQLSKRDSLGMMVPEDVSLLTLANGYISQEDFLSKIKLDEPNWILIVGNNNVVTSDVFNNVKSIPVENKEKTMIRIFSMEKLDHTEKLSYQSLYNYGYTYATDQLEYFGAKNKFFNETYLKENYKYPSDYVSRGFDVAYDAVLRVLKSKAGKEDLYDSSYRTKYAFDYKNIDGIPVQENQSVFINSIGKTEEEGLKIIRLR